MKKLFTLVALLAMALGVNAQQWEEVYKIDYSTLQGFPFYVMGYVPEWVNGVMTDYGADYRYATQTDLDGDGDAKWKDGESSVGTTKTSNGTEYQKVTGAGPYWHQYIISADVPMLIDETYKVKAVVKATEAVNANLQFGNWGSLKETGVAIPQDTEFQEVEWEVTGCMYNGSGFICIQPGTSTATIEWKSLTVYHKMKENQRPKVWLEDIENGDAETPWTPEQAAIKYNDTEKNFTICAWSKEKGHNVDETAEGQPWNPFPATIVTDPDDSNNHVFLVDGQPATTTGDPSAWDNQFWIQSKHAWKSGTTLKIKFRYKCNSSNPVKTNTQIHKQNPSDYLIWHAIGDITFTDQWQTFEKDMAIADDMAGGWSIAFNLNPEVKDAVKFYFDDLSWQYLKLDEGYFVSGINATTTTSYDNLDNAIEFEEGEDWDGNNCLVAIVGTPGDATTYVDQIMISTTRGDDQAFKGATLKPTEKFVEEEWKEYTAATNAKIDLPGLGVWAVYLDVPYTSIAFKMLEGTKYEQPDPVAIVTNPSVLVVNALERQPTATEQPADPDAGIEAGTGQPWDNQFFIKANRILKTDEVTVIEFDYVASQEAKSTTQCHALPGEYRGGGMGDVNFTTEEQHFIGEFKVPSHEKADIQTMVFNLAEIKDACQYTFKNIKWYLKSDQEGMTDENLIDAEGTANFSWIVVGGTGIENVTVKNAKTSNAIYNIAGQRVNNDYKGLVIKDGKKFVK